MTRSWASALWLTALGSLVLLVLPRTGFPEGGTPTAGDRDPRWAVPLQRDGLPNLHRVTDTVYRGAQPTAEGFSRLKEMGVRTVVSLRAFHGERKTVETAGLEYVHFSVKTWHPEDKDMRAVVAILMNPDRQPVFVHCRDGADRTGTAIALYRIVAQGWSREDAIDEMVHGGFRFHHEFQNLVRYVLGFQVDPAEPQASPAP